MKRLVLCFALFTAGICTAQDAGIDAGQEMTVIDAGGVMAPAPVVVQLDGGVGASLDDPTPFVKMAYKSVAGGDWWGAAAAVLVLLIAVLRKYGKWLHEKIPDTNPLDKIFYFFLETKPGGWLMNLLTSVAGLTGTAMLAGQPVTWAIVKPILLVSVTGAALWELAKDVFGAFKKREVAPAPVASVALVPPPPEAPVATPPVP
jgi:hypothetical protein